MRKAVAWLRRAIETNRNYPIAHLRLAATLAHLGRLSEARSAAQAGLALNAAYTIARERAAAPSDNPLYLSQRERVLEGMRKAGVPEGRALSSRQLIEQSFSLLQIERVEAFGEPAVDRSEQIAGLIALALIAQERHAPRRMQGRLLLMTEVYAGIFANL
jgi:hypothetical protein